MKNFRENPPPEKNLIHTSSNTNIPNFMTKKPWYLGKDSSEKHDLSHQSLQKNVKASSIHFVKPDPFKPSKKPKRFRAGACTNCGAMTHNAKNCLDRPRSKKRSAKHLNTTFSRDEVVVKEVGNTYDESRDRWSGYDASTHKVIASDSSAPEKPNNPDGAGSTGLRIREDTAKYLMNLDPESAHYDPKTRSMQENPLPGEDNVFKGEKEYAEKPDKQTQILAWEIPRLPKEHETKLEAALEDWNVLNELEGKLKNGHAYVFGSYYDKAAKKWGFKCCYQTNKNAYCTGEVGREAVKGKEEDKIGVNKFGLNRDEFLKELEEKRRQSGILSSISRETEKRELMFATKPK